MNSPDELDPDEIEARWSDLTAQLGEISGKREAPRSPSGGPRDYQVDEDDDEFVPPEPDARAFTARSVLGWFLIAVGLVGVLVVTLTNTSGILGILCGVIGMSGLVVLVTGLPAHRDHDDDGAQV